MQASTSFAGNWSGSDLRAEPYAQSSAGSSRENLSEITDSGYGSADGKFEPRRRESIKRKVSLTQRRQRSNREGSNWLETAIKKSEKSLFKIDTDADSLLDFSSDGSPPTTPSSSPSTPEPSEPDLEITPQHILAKATTRRHTIPPHRRRQRTASLSIAVTAPILDEISSISITPNYSKSTPIFYAIVILTVAISSLSLFVSTPLLAASPVHLLHPEEERLFEYTNAFLSLLLITPSVSSVGLGLANLATLRALEKDSELPNGWILGSFVWLAILAVRTTFAWLFGRGMGWAHPGLFFNGAVHEVGAGLAPLLLALLLVWSLQSKADTNRYFQVASLAANFATPVVNGGSSLWWGISALVVGGAVGAGNAAWSKMTTKKSNNSSKSTSLQFIPILSLLLLPILATYSTSPTLSSSSIENTFVNLHPKQSNLLNILLMTAPRPGNPDFLFQTIESWLGALPTPATSSASNSSFEISDRIRLVVYTHFLDHESFDSAQTFFTSSPSYSEKAARYIDWHRDERATSNRLDQRLHVARGLEYASTAGQESEYVLLTEDDFPLCPDNPGKKSWKKTWSEFMRAVVETNLAMPDIMARVEEGQKAQVGHCGIFIATGGSGLAIRSSIAKKLPALLLGADDPQGYDREARAERGEFSVKREDEGADTPDLVIQDCLRGRIAGCEMCGSNIMLNEETVENWTFPIGSARNPFSLPGNRYGKSGLVVTPTLLQHHLGYNSSTLPGRSYGKEEWNCEWRQPFNGDSDIFVTSS